MAQVGDLPEQFLDAALVRYERIEAASSHVAKAVALELADAVMLNGSLPDEQRERFAAVAGKLVDIIGLSHELLSDIVSVTGLTVELDSSIAVQGTVQQALPAPATPALPEGRAGSDEGAGQATRARRAPTSGSRGAQSTRGGGTDGSAETEGTLSELYRAIVDPATTPEMQVDDSKKAVLTIVGNNEIKFGDRSVELEGHSLYIFNALLRLRNEPRSVDEIKSLGFYPDAKSETARSRAFNSQIKSLLENVNQAAGREVFKLVEREGTSWYVVNPHVVLEDTREPGSIPSGPAEANVVKKK